MVLCMWFREFALLCAKGEILLSLLLDHLVEICDFENLIYLMMVGDSGLGYLWFVLGVQWDNLEFLDVERLDWKSWITD